MEDQTQISIQTYPNPFQNSWTVRTDHINKSSIQIVDVLGKNVLSIWPNSKEDNIDGSSLNSELYFAKIQTE